VGREVPTPADRRVTPRPMSSDQPARELEDVAREIDLAVFRLERPLAAGADPEAERAALRRTLEQLRDRIEQLSRAL
jgi:hypothetical protein